MASLTTIYKSAKEASKNPKTSTTWMHIKQNGKGYNGWVADERDVQMMEKVGSLIAFRFDNGVKTAGLYMDK